jgi:hypothetical protein
MRFVMTDTYDSEATLSRVNIIFHGLMAFRELDARYYEVLIPPAGADDPCHQAKFGNPLLHDWLHDFVNPPYDAPPFSGPAHYSIEGVSPESPGRIALPSTANALILRNSLLDVQYGMVRAIVKVPRPHIIRHYRGTETGDLTFTINDTGGSTAPPSDTRSAIVKIPPVVHEVTVFSYFEFYHPRRVGPRTDYHIWRPYRNMVAANLCIYCQPLESCQESDNPLFNSMFHLKNPSDPTKPVLGVDLALINLMDDGPVINTSKVVGINTEELLALSELYSSGVRESISARDPSRTLGILKNSTAGMPGGCGGGFICDDVS